MLVREGNKIRFFMNTVFEEDERDSENRGKSTKKISNADIQSMLKKVSASLEKEMSSDITLDDLEDVSESYLYKEDVQSFFRKYFTKGGKVETWLNEIIIQIQKLLNSSSFQKRPTHLQGGWCYQFGVVDTDDRLKKETIPLIEDYIKVIKKVPSVIEISDSNMRENTNVLNAVKQKILKHISPDKDLFYPFFCITSISKEKDGVEHDCFGFTLGVLSSPENMKGISGGVKEGSVKGKDFYHYEISSVYISGDNIVKYEIEIPEFLEKLLKLREKRKIKFATRSKTGSRSKVKGSVYTKNKMRDVTKSISDDNDDYEVKPNPRGSKEDKFYDIVKDIEKKGVENYTVNQIVDLLLPYVFDEDYEDLKEKIGDTNLTKMGDYSVSINSPEVYLALFKSIKDLSFKDVDSFKSSVEKDRKDKKKKSQDDIKTAVSSPSKKSTSDKSTVVSKNTDKTKNNAKTVVSSV